MNLDAHSSLDPLKGYIVKDQGYHHGMTQSINNLGYIINSFCKVSIIMYLEKPTKALF